MCPEGTHRVTRHPTPGIAHQASHTRHSTHQAFHTPGITQWASHARHHMPGIPHQASHTRHHTPGIPHQASHTRHHTPGIPHQAFHTRNANIQHMPTFTTQTFLYHIPHQAVHANIHHSDIPHQAAHANIHHSDFPVPHPTPGSTCQHSPLRLSCTTSHTRQHMPTFTTQTFPYHVLKLQQLFLHLFHGHHLRLVQHTTVYRRRVAILP